MLRRRTGLFLHVLLGKARKKAREAVAQDPREGALLPLYGKEREWPPDHKERERPPNNPGARRVGGRGRQSIFVCVVVSGFLGLGRKMGQEDPRTETQDPRPKTEEPGSRIKGTTTSGAKTFGPPPWGPWPEE